MNLTLFCADIWYRVIHLLVTGAMLLFYSFSCLIFVLNGDSKIAANVRGLPQGWNSCCVRPATEAD